jgi:hypothetical protein
LGLTEVSDCLEVNEMDVVCYCDGS